MKSADNKGREFYQQRSIEFKEAIRPKKVLTHSLETKNSPIAYRKQTVRDLAQVNSAIFLLQRLRENITQRAKHLIKQRLKGLK